MAKQSFDEGVQPPPSLLSSTHILLDMLTPIDQPLDKLEDLQGDEM
jgi:hypothetical protein